MNTIAVLNLNSYVPGKVHESFWAAAERWGVDYTEIRTPLGPYHAFWQKAMICTSAHVTAYERVLQLDGDMLIRSDAPSPFDLVPKDRFGVVSKIQPGRRPQALLTRPGMRTSRLLGIRPYARPEQHLNAGFILYTPALHRDILLRWQKIGRRNGWPRIPFPEQVALSCLLSYEPHRVTWLPWTWNTCDVPRRFPRGPMQTYIYHLHAPHKPSLAAIMERYQWKI